MAPAPISHGRLDWLQCLRAFSLLVVVAYHVGTVVDIHFKDSRLVHWFGFGHCGVDIFFVISGFILYRLHHGEFGRPDRTPTYLKKRFVRICPLYWLLTTAVLLPALIAPGLVKAYKLTGAGILESYLLFPIHYAGLPIIPPAWSLFHEVKFYAFFALLIAFPAPWHRWWMSAWCIGSIGTTAWIILAKPVFENFWDFFWMGPHNLMFLSGCLSGWLINKSKPVMPPAGAFLTAGFLLLAFIAWLDVGEVISRLARMGGYAAAGFLLVTGSVALDNGHEKTRVAPAWLVRLGDASYSAYLIHFPFLFVAAKTMVLLIGPETAHRYAIPLALLLLASSMPVCLATYRWIEKPLTRKCRTWAGLEAA